MDVLGGFNLRATRQSTKADRRQVRNSAGGFTFEVTPEVRLRRFLVRGVDGGTYYLRAQDLAKENAAVVMNFAENRTGDLVREIVEISTSCRASKQNPALYREQINPDAKLVVVGMTATDFTIADPFDAGMLDVAGFDSAVPQLVSDFARGV